MKLHTRDEFLKLPENTIYSRVPSHDDLCEGLFCKSSGPNDYKNDFNEQDLISECGYPDGIDDGCDSLIYQLQLRDSFKDFRTDLNCCGRDGMFCDDDKFIVWDNIDILNLMNVLSRALKR